MTIGQLYIIGLAGAVAGCLLKWWDRQPSGRRVLAMCCFSVGIGIVLCLFVIQGFAYLRAG